MAWPADLKKQARLARRAPTPGSAPLRPPLLARPCDTRAPIILGWEGRGTVAGAPLGGRMRDAAHACRKRALPAAREHARARAAMVTQRDGHTARHERCW